MQGIICQAIPTPLRNFQMKVYVFMDVYPLKKWANWSSTPSQARLSAEWSITGTGSSSLHVCRLARFLDLTTRELSRGVGGRRLEALVFLLWPSCKVGSGFSAVGSPATKCRLQTLESLLGIQRVPFKLFLLILFAHCNRRSGFFFSVGNGNNLKGRWQSHMLEPLLQHCYNHEAHKS